jgi:hypothetical protein
MSHLDDNEPQTRRERLAAIAEEYTEEIHTHRAQHQLAGVESISRYAAVTSEGSAESSHASNGNLLVAETAAELAELLRQECGEGWVAHGRVWDLDAPFDVWGNLEGAYSVRVGEEGRSPIYIVLVEGREAGVYLFEDLVDAEAFQEVVRLYGGWGELTEEPLHDHRGAERLIDAERRDEVGYDPRAYCPECHARAKAGSRNRISATHCEYECPGGHGFFSLREPVIAGRDDGR